MAKAITAKPTPTQKASLKPSVSAVGLATPLASRLCIGNLAIALSVIAASTISQALVTKVGVKPVLMAGLAFLGGGLGYFTQLPVNGSER